MSEYSAPVQFIDLAAQQAKIRDKIDAAIAAVLDHGRYIMGPEVAQLEKSLADFVDMEHCISCANGTDALHLALMALNVKAGDAVFVPSFTFAATAEAPALIGANVFFVDVDLDSYCMCPRSLNRTIQHARSLGFLPKCVIAVDLFGRPADYIAITKICREHDTRLVCDSAQGLGARIDDRSAASFGDITTTSFFPAKPLGCYGDGGALFTDCVDVANTLRSLRVHGKGSHKYENELIGVNSRLDTLQAAILLEKLAIFPKELRQRDEIACTYLAGITRHFELPILPDNYFSSWAQFTLRCENSDQRSSTMTTLRKLGVPTNIYYPKPLHLQAAYRHFGGDPDGLQRSVLCSNTVFSVPMHPYLEKKDVEYIIDALNNSDFSNDGAHNCSIPDQR